MSGHIFFNFHYQISRIRSNNQMQIWSRLHNIAWLLFHHIVNCASAVGIYYDAYKHTESQLFYCTYCSINCNWCFHSGNILYAIEHYRKLLEYICIYWCSNCYPHTTKSNAKDIAWEPFYILRLAEEGSGSKENCIFSITLSYFNTQKQKHVGGYAIIMPSNLGCIVVLVRGKKCTKTGAYY